jgi:hypothetical protein
MCFAPQISILTAIIEWALALIILLRFKKSLVPWFSSIFIFLLGLYQFTEFMMCKTASPLFWAHIGFLTYTFLPAVGMHYVLMLTHKGSKSLACYIPPVLFSILSILAVGFVQGSTCHSVFISTQLQFFDPVIHRVIMLIYDVYYFGLLLLASFIAWKAMRKEKDDLRRKTIGVALTGVWLATLPAFIFVILLPAFSIQFPSVYCEFALLMAITAFIVADMDHRNRKKKKS